MAGIHVAIPYVEGSWKRELLITLLVHEGDEREAYRYCKPNIGERPLKFKRHRCEKRFGGDRCTKPKHHPGECDFWGGIPAGAKTVDIPVVPDQHVVCQTQIHNIARDHAALIEENTRLNNGGRKPEPTPEPKPEPPKPEPKVRFPDDLPSRPAHRDQPKVDKRVEAGIPTYLWGHAGSGKSQMAQVAARNVGVQYYETIMAGAVGSSVINGRDTKSGTFESGSVKAYRDGGLVNYEEIDSAHPTSLLAFNNPISSDVWDNPVVGMLRKNATFRVVATANTLGNGADKAHNGRMKLDAATINRFLAGRVHVTRDDELENHLVKGILDGADSATLKNAERFYRELHRLRKFAAERKLGEGLESMRPMIDGMKMIAVGVPMAEILGALASDWNADTRAQARIG